MLLLDLVYAVGAMLVVTIIVGVLLDRRNRRLGQPRAAWRGIWPTPWPRNPEGNWIVRPFGGGIDPVTSDWTHADENREDLSS